MKYWVFQNNQVNGPYGPEELSQISFYSPESLVCPEGRRGTSMDDWQRAGLVPELASSLLKSTQLAVSGRGSGSSSGGLPPEPTLRDLASLGHVQEKCVALESALKDLEERLKQRDSDITEAQSLFKKALTEHERTIAELKSSLGSVEERIAPIPMLRDNLDQAKTLEHALEESLQTQRKSIVDMTAQIESLKTGVGALEKPKPAMAPPPRPAPIVPPQPAQLTSLEPDKLPAVPLPSVIAGNLPDPSALEKKAAPPAPVKAPVPVPAVDQAASSVPPAKPKSKKLALMAVAGAVLLGGGGYWFLMNSKKKPAPPPPPPPEIQAPPPEEPPPPVISPEELEAQLKASALEAVKSFATPRGKTVGAELEALSPSADGMAPWMTEKTTDGNFQVNFFAQKGAALSKSVAFEFLVQIVEGGAKISAKNAAATAILAGTPFDGLKSASKKKVRIKPKPAVSAEDEDIGQIFSDLGGAKGDGTAKPAPGEESSPIDDINLPGLERSEAAPLDAKTAAPASRKRTSKKAPAPAPASDADLLDELLKP